jgi:hypothetical protein
MNECVRPGSSLVAPKPTCWEPLADCSTGASRPLTFECYRQQVTPTRTSKSLPLSVGVYARRGEKNSVESLRFIYLPPGSI